MAEPEPPLEESVRIEAAADDVWDVVSDLRRMGEWGPSAWRCTCGADGCARVPVTGVNRRKLMVWPTTSRIHLCDDRRAIGWTVMENRSRWSYRLTDASDPGHDATLLTERRELPDGKSWVGKAFGAVFLGGKTEHDAELRAGVRTTLARIKAAAESR